MRDVRSAVLIAAFAMLVGGPTLAQDVDWHRFYPLEMGDTWVLSFYERECPTNPDDSCSPAIQRVVNRTVIGTVEVGEERVERPLVRAEVRLTADGPLSCVGEYAVWLDETTADVQIVNQGGNACPYAYRTEPLGGNVILEGEADVDDGFREEQEVLIGEVPYTLLTHRMTAYPGLSETYFTFGLDVGLVDMINFFSLSGSGFSTQTSYDLIYAEVGGVVYGTPPVASEPGAAPASFALGDAFPNPFRTTTTLALRLPAAEDVTLEAFDLLSRRVLREDLGVMPAGESRHVFDGSALPPGVYFVRATTASGLQATRRLVRVD